MIKAKPVTKVYGGPRGGNMQPNIVTPRTDIIVTAASWPPYGRQIVTPRTDNDPDIEPHKVGRPKVHASPAARNKAYRARKRANG